MEMHSKPTVYAIDFGTSNSLLAGANADAFTAPIPLEAGANDPTILRTLLYFPDAEHCFYGAEAIEEYAAHGMEGRLIRSIKKHLPSRGFVGTHIGGRPMNLEHLVGAFLRELRRRANEHFDTDVRRVVLGRPARFSNDDLDDQHGENRLAQAARIAGFEDIRFCPEPVAAGRDFAERIEKERLVLVADLGGGTSDFTVLRMRPESYDPSDVLAIGGVAVAGDALDGSLMRRHVARNFGAEVTYKLPMGNNIMTMPSPLMEKLCSPADLSLLRERQARAFLTNVRRWSLGEQDEQRIDQLFTLIEDGLGFSIFEAIEHAKRELSDSETSEVRFSYPTIEVREPIDRPAFLLASERQRNAILACLDQTIADAGVTFDDVELVCCTGGTARVPCIAEAMASRFGAHKMVQRSSFHSVVMGLAERARAMAAES